MLPESRTRRRAASSIGGKWFEVLGAQAVEADVQQPVPHLRAALVGDLDGVAVADWRMNLF